MADEQQVIQSVNAFDTFLYLRWNSLPEDLLDGALQKGRPLQGLPGISPCHGPGLSHLLPHRLLHLGVTAQLEQTKLQGHRGLRDRRGYNTVRAELTSVRKEEERGIFLFNSCCFIPRSSPPHLQAHTLPLFL